MVTSSVPGRHANTVTVALPVKSPFGRNPAVRRTTRTGPSGRQATSPGVSLNPAGRSATFSPASVRVDGATTRDRSSGRPSRVRRTPSSGRSTAPATGGNGVVAGVTRTTSRIARFQKIVLAVAVQRRSPLTRSVASPTPAASSQSTSVDPSAACCSRAEASTMRRAESTEATIRPAATTAAETDANRRGRKRTSPRPRVAPSTSTARAQLADRARGPRTSAR